MIIRLLAAAALVAPFLTADAQRTTPPEAAPPPDFSLPAPRTFSLDNGLQVTLLRFGSTPKASASLVVRAGNVDEGPEEVWLADVTGDMLLEGTTTRDAQRIAREAAEMGGSVNVSVGPNTTLVLGDVMSESLPAFLRLVADVALNPAFPPGELPRIQANRVRQVSIARSRPQAMAQEKFRAVMYPDHPYGRLYPAPEMIQGYTVDRLRAFHDRHFVASGARLYVVGQFDERATETTIRSAFASWRAGTSAAPRIPQPTSRRVIHLVELPGAVQSTLNIGLPVVDPSHADYVPLLVTNTLLGGYFSSRITANIREDKGYTYSPFSTISARYRDAHWMQVADVTTNVTGASLREIFHEIDRLQAEPPPEEELRAVQNYLAGTFLLQSSSRGGLLSQLSFADLHGVGRRYFETYVERVRAVTPEDVSRMARTYLDDEKMLIVVVGDPAQIREQIAPFGEVMRQ